jgi:enoyl-CoA hydratase/carnithine racemase
VEGGVDLPLVDLDVADGVATVTLSRPERGNAIEHLGVEADSIARMAATADGREGVRAFVERRPPRFSG